jgi:hypothetical protein
VVLSVKRVLKVEIGKFLQYEAPGSARAGGPIILVSRRERPSYSP